MSFDVVVIGGGPAGLAAAVGLGRAGKSVLVCESAADPGSKPCGEGLLPRAVRELCSLGLRSSELLAEGRLLQGVSYVSASGVRHRLAVLRRPESLERLVDDLVERFERVERGDVERLEGVAAFVEGEGCHTARLVGYFGEAFEGACGHCTFCRTGEAVHLPDARERPAYPDMAEVERLRAAHPGVFAEPRALARFLCGLTSPALTAAKLTRHELFGRLETADFREVLAWARDRPQRSQSS